MSEPLKKYSIVKFSDGLQVVPSCWLNNNKSICIWPDHVKSLYTLNKLLESAQYPSNGNTWKNYEVEKWYASANEWARAQEKLADSMYNSEILDSDEYSDEEMQRRLKAIRRNNSRRIYNSSDEEPSMSHCETNTKKKKRKTDENMAKTLPSLPKVPRFSSLSNKDKANNNIQNNDTRNSSKLFISTVNNEQPCHSRTPIESPSNMDNMVQNENSTDGRSSFHQHISARENIKNKECESEIDFCKFVMNGIETLIKESKSLAARLNSVEAQITHRNNLNVIADDSDDENIMLPIRSYEQLNELEKSLQDKLFFQKLSLRLKASGGQKLSLIVAAIMGKLLTDELAVQYSWKGRKGKKPVNKLQQLTKLLKKTIQLMCPSSSEKEIEEAAGLWLSQASTRIKRAEAKN